MPVVCAVFEHSWCPLQPSWAGANGRRTFLVPGTGNRKVTPNSCLLCMTHRAIFPGDRPAGGMQLRKDCGHACAADQGEGGQAGNWRVVVQPPAAAASTAGASGQLPSPSPSARTSRLSSAASAPRLRPRINCIVALLLVANCQEQHTGDGC